MLLRIPDEYQALTDWLDRQGIPYKIEVENYKRVLENRAKTLEFMKIIDLNNVKLAELIERAVKYIEEQTKVDKYTMEHLYNESLKISYSELTGRPYKGGESI